MSTWLSYGLFWQKFRWSENWRARRGKGQDWFQIVLSIKMSLGLCNLKINLSQGLLCLMLRLGRKVKTCIVMKGNRGWKRGNQLANTTDRGRIGTPTWCFCYLIQGSFHFTIARPVLPLPSPALWKISILAICRAWETFCVYDLEEFKY